MLSDPLLLLPAFELPVHTGSMLGFLFAIITLKLSLGSAGIIPGLGIPAGLISFALLKSWTGISTSLGLQEKSPRLHNLLFKPFLVQENSVMQVRTHQNHLQQMLRSALAVSSRQQAFSGKREHHAGARRHSS
jgi:hypothetical protein